MEYETSYDTGAKPFNHDKNRGSWESSKDFLYACVGHAFRPDIVTIIPLMVFQSIGIFALIPYFIMLAVCVVPIVFIQSFLGQFSGTGFISVFRIAPLFKGIGYVSLVINIINLTYYSVFSAIPLFYLFHSLRPTIPWSCEGSSQWLGEHKSVCGDRDKFYGRKIPSVEFLKNHFYISSEVRNLGTFFSVQVMLCTIIIWCIATFVLLKSTEFIGRFMRYSCLAILAIMSLCLVRFIFLPGAINGLLEFILPQYMEHNMHMLFLIPLMAFSTLGPGWGSILTMASYNDFKTNIYRYSWFMCLAQLGVIIGMSCLTMFLEHFMKEHGIVKGKESFGEWTEFLKLPFGLTFLELPNFWSVLFFGMIGLGSLNLLVIQLFSLFTSLFDEFETLREIKRNVILGTVAVLALTSMLFCSNQGLFLFEFLSKLSVVTQVILNLILLLIVLWVYGRERLQRDLHFMISQIYSTWMVFVVRFVAPILLLIGLIVGFVLSILTTIFHDDEPSAAFVLCLIALFVFVLVWCLIPCYCIVKIKQTAGNIGIRLKRCVRPTDWYPADPAYKQSYEDRFSSTDISHPLTILTEE